MPYISVTGPESDVNHEGDEIPVWTVCVADDRDGDPVGKIYWYHNHSAAQDLGRRMARDQRLELVDESMPA